MPGLVAPSFNFVATSASSLTAKRVVRLEELLPDYTPLTEPFELTGLTLSRQTIDLPAGLVGDMTAGFDFGGDYVANSGFPVREDCEPFALHCMGAIEWPGPRMMLRDLASPITYRPGVDLIVMATEQSDCASPASKMQLFAGFNFNPPGGVFAKLPGIVYSMRSNGSAPSGAPICYRSRVPTLSAGGSQVRVHFSALNQGLALTRASIGVQSGTGANMAATPVPLTFGGNAGLTLDPWRTGWSDWVSLATSAGQSLLVNLSIGGAWAFKDGTGASCSWYAFDHDSHAEATMGGTVGYQATRTHGFDCVQVQ